MKPLLVAWCSQRPAWVSSVTSLRPVYSSVDTRCGACCRTRHRPQRVRRLRNSCRSRVVASGTEASDHSPTGELQLSKRSGVRGRVFLLAVPFIWSTYSPSMRFLFQLSDVPPSAALLNLGPALCGALGFLVPILMKLGGRSASAWGRSGTSAAGGGRSALPFSIPHFPAGFAVGIELGVYMFLGTVLQLLALRFSPASQVGFLLQTSVVFTALLQRFWASREASGKSSQDLRQGAAIACSLCGTTLLILDDDPNLFRRMLSGLGLASKPALHPGMAFIEGCTPLSAKLAGQISALAAAVLYALFTIRLSSERVRKSDAITVASVKTATLAVLSLIWYSMRADWQMDAAFFHRAGQSGLIAYILSTIWNGIFGTALTTWLQVKGQGAGRVSPTEAGIVYATSPLWGAFISVTLLQERMGWLGWFGSALILSSVVLMNLRQSDATSNANESKSAS